MISGFSSLGNFFAQTRNFRTSAPPRPRYTHETPGKGEYFYQNSNGKQGNIGVEGEQRK